MPSSDFAPDPHPAAPRQDLENYRALSPPAVIALVLGIASPVSWISPVLWIVPALGIVLAIVALRAIARNPANLTGRKLATAGLALALLFGSATLSQAASRAWWLRSEACQVVELWCGLLADDQPAMAHCWMVEPDKRHLDDATLWPYYRNTADAREALEAFVAERSVRFLLAHGKQVQIRYWMSESLGQAHDGADMVRLFYVVTRQREGTKESFFLRFSLRREPGNPDLSAWTIVEARGRVNPFEDET